MSYDIDIGGVSFNYTSNLSELFYTHMPNKRGLWALDGLTGRQAGQVIAYFWASFESERINLCIPDAVGEPVLANKYDTKNGWGSLIGALSFIGRVQAACADHPRHIVRVSA